MVRVNDEDDTDVGDDARTAFVTKALVVLRNINVMMTVVAVEVDETPFMVT